jgi:putative DNA primase/helicase
MLLGTPHGTVKLKTGELVKAERNHWITKLCSVAPAEPGTDAPIWNEFLNRIFDGNQSLIQFMQRAAGYALTGHTTEHKLLFLFGTGSNGKSVFLNTIFNIMGDYSKRAAAQTFLNSSGDKHPTDLAGLCGARLVAGSELPAGKVWNESVVKDLTGGDIVTARFMRGDFFDYMPQFTLFIAGNHRPSFSGIDESIRRRVCLVPFTQTIPAEERDPDLPEKLKAEWPAILRWMIDGALEWQRIGLAVPNAVSAASAEYMEDEDTMTEFFDENLVKVPFSSVSVADMYERFSTWQRVSGVGKVWSKKAMSNSFAESGIKAEKLTGGARHYKGYSLKPEPAHYRSANGCFIVD